MEYTFLYAVIGPQYIPYYLYVLEISCSLYNPQGWPHIPFGKKIKAALMTKILSPISHGFNYPWNFNFISVHECSFCFHWSGAVVSLSSSSFFLRFKKKLLSNPYTQHGPWTQSPKIKGMLCWLSQPSAPCPCFLRWLRGLTGWLPTPLSVFCLFFFIFTPFSFLFSDFFFSPRCLLSWGSSSHHPLWI